MKGLKLRVPEAPIQIAFVRAPRRVADAGRQQRSLHWDANQLVNGAGQPLISMESAKYYEVSKEMGDQEACSGACR